MAKRPFNIMRFAGVNKTDDPFVIGQTKPEVSTGNLNFRAEKGIKVARGGYAKLGGQTAFKRSGVYFPYGAKAILPSTFEKSSEDGHLGDTFWCAGVEDFTVETWYKCNYLPENRYICRIPNLSINSATQHMCAMLYPLNDQFKTAVSMRFITGDSGTESQAIYYYEGVPTDGDWHHMAIKRDSGGCDIQIDGESSSNSMDVDSGDHSTDNVVHGDSIFNDGSNYFNALPLYGNHLEIGDSELALAEFRIWSDYRTDQEIIDNMDVQLDV